MPALVTLNVAGNDLRPPKGERPPPRRQRPPPKGERPPPRGQRPPPKGERPSTKTGRRGRRDPAAAATGMRRTDAVANGPLPTFVVSADPSSRAVYTSPVLATPNGDLLYRPPPPPPSPAAKPGRPESSTGPLCVTRSNPTQPNPTIRTQPNATNNLSAWCNRILSNSMH